MALELLVCKLAEGDAQAFRREREGFVTLGGDMSLGFERRLLQIELMQQMLSSAPTEREPNEQAQKAACQGGCAEIHE